MSTPPGQAAKHGIKHAARQGALRAAGNAGRLAHLLGQLALGLVIIGAIGVSVLAVRLAQGPLELPWLARRIAAAASDSSTQVTIESVALTWEGLQGGVDRPLDLVLRDVTVTDSAGQRLARVPRASVSLVMIEALSGRLALRAVELDGLQLTVQRAPEGAATLDLGPEDTTAAAPAEDFVRAVLATLTAPPGGSTDRAGAVFSHLRRARLHDAAVVVHDRLLGLDWSLPAVEVDLQRAANGGASGTAVATIAIAGQRMQLDARLALLAQNGGITLAASLGRTNPALLATAPALAALAVLDAPVTLSGSATFDGGLALLGATLKADIEAGALHIGDGTMPIRAATLHAAATPDSVDLTLDQLLLQARDDARPSHASAHIQATRAAGHIDAQITADIDQVAFADLPVLWPAGVGGPGTRPWIVTNLVSGIAHNGHVALSLTAPEDLSDATVLNIEGGVDGSDITCYWLRPVPPIEHGEAKVRFVDPDTVDILTSAGRQSGTQMTLRAGKVRVTGIAGHDQFLSLQTEVNGPFGDLITLLGDPRIGLLGKRPINLHDPRGVADGKLMVDLPLRTDLQIDDVAIRATGKLTEGHIGGIAAGRDIDHAAFDYDVGNAGLKISGSADIAGLPSQLKLDMDFRAGGPAQVLQRVGLSATATARQLAALGLNPNGALSGAVGLQLDYLERRDTAGDLRLAVDLAQTGIEGGRVPWRKPPGPAGTLDAHALLKSGKLVSIERLRAEAPGLSVLATADATAGQLSLVHINRLILGETTNVTGELRLPTQPGQPYVASLSGPSLDLSHEFGSSTPDKSPDARGPAYRIDAKLDRAVMAGGRAWSNVVAHIDNDGLITSSAELTATAGTGKLHLGITPQPGGRRLVAEAQDAGAMLGAMGIVRTMEGGHLSVSGTYDDTNARHALRGTAEIASATPRRWGRSCRRCRFTVWWRWRRGRGSASSAWRRRSRWRRTC
jgi:hypothetical protein